MKKKHLINKILDLPFKHGEQVAASTWEEYIAYHVKIGFNSVPISLNAKESPGILII